MNNKSLLIAVFLGTVAAVLLGTCIAEAKESVRLQDIDVLTFTNGEYTRGRRRSAVPQLKCVGGSAKGKYEPHTAMCKNIGFDGRDVAWKCEADLPGEYNLGKVTVICEGYDYPEDSYVLKDSCGLEYNLEFSETGRQHTRYHDKDYRYVRSNERVKHGFIAGIFYTIYDWTMSILTLPFRIVGWFFSLLFKTGSTFLKIVTSIGAVLIGLSLFRAIVNRREHHKQYPTSAGRPVKGMGPAGLAGGSKEQGSTGPGFWSGVVGGSLATYFFNRQQNREVYQRADGTWSRVPANVPVDAPPPPADNHESTAYGTTKRR